MSQKVFKGRPFAGGAIKAEAVVSHQGFNTLASCQKSAMGIKPKDTEAGTAKIFVSDQNNPDLFGKLITGKALCLPITIGSTTGGMILQTICAMKAQPAAMLFSETADLSLRKFGKTTLSSASTNSAKSFWTTSKTAI